LFNFSFEHSLLFENIQKKGDSIKKLISFVEKAQETFPFMGIYLINLERMGINNTKESPDEFWNIYLLKKETDDPIQVATLRQGNFGLANSLVIEKISK
jgi:hypothetical protein